MDAEALERLLDLLEHRRHGVARKLRQLADVVALVAVLGRLLPAPDRLDRLAELVHLRARVVVVVLALDLVAAELEEAGERVADRAVPRRGDDDRPGRVRRDHLDLHPLAPLGEAAAERPARATSASAFENHESARKRLTKPGPATSARSTSGSSAAAAASSSPSSRGERFWTGASRSATFVA